ncbi:hypothetical protein QP519_10605 [Weeksella virosa]|uniref:hypothetical protein n=1 Tax=Weeksella virosa TaxID=1014 RepID=UPI0025552F49|nr:hypothetical protein [Weeksella virosa]MDK7375984.1 hypothetical protein [Weeksella virosa]
MNKIRKISLEQQVKTLLHERGYSHLYTQMDFQYFRKFVKNEYNKAFAIACLFIKEARESQINSDYNQYIF